MQTQHPQPSTPVLPELLTPTQAAQVLNVTEGTLAIWRCEKRYHLPFVKVGRKVFYRKSDLIDWLDSRVRQLEHAL
ncbi:MAG: helix-turn-helix domain-containing protein [Betaproteobacteria bacterium]|nr:helix-turn-helix domain-containing protein [Betaproteobacteria bacterium]